MKNHVNNIFNWKNHVFGIYFLIYISYFYDKNRSELSMLKNWRFDQKIVWMGVKKYIKIRNCRMSVTSDRLKKEC